MPILYPQRQVLSRSRVREQRVVLARRVRLLEQRRLREFNDCNLPRGASDGGRFGANDDPRCGDSGEPPLRPGEIRKTGRKTDRREGESHADWRARLERMADTTGRTNPYRREGFHAKKGQQPYDAANYTVTHPDTIPALEAIALAEKDPEVIKDKQFAYMQEHEPAVVESARELQRYAKEAHEEFVAQLTDLSKTLGVDLTYANVESDEFLDQTNEAIGLGPIKGVERTSVKAAEYNGNVLMVKDMLRSTIVVDNVAGMADALEQLTEVMDVSVKDNVSKPQPGGWRAYNVIARLKKSGMLVEVQITTREMMRAKREGHVYFAQARTMPKTDPRYPGLIAKQEKIYNRAWRASGGSTRRALTAIAAMATFIATLGPV